jgi:hypothetical protein
VISQSRSAAKGCGGGVNEVGYGDTCKNPSIPFFGFDPRLAGARGLLVRASMSASHFGEPIGRPTLSAFHDGCRAGLHDAGCQAERGEGGRPWSLHIRIETARQLGVIARVTVIPGKQGGGRRATVWP